MTPKVALAENRTRLVCRSLSNKPVRKRCTSSKPKVWIRVISRLCNGVAGGEITDAPAQSKGILTRDTTHTETGLLLHRPERFNPTSGCLVAPVAQTK